jgi:hemoglobin
MGAAPGVRGTPAAPGHPREIGVSSKRMNARDAQPADPKRAPGDLVSDSDLVSDLARVGGQEKLQAIIDNFIDRVRADMMIGYLFRHVDIEALKRKEASFAAHHLGGDEPYSGRPLKAAHAPHRVKGGQFDRRLTILSETLADHGVPADICQRWLDHNRSLRTAITVDDAGLCSP